MGNWGILEVLLIDLAALVTIWGFFYMQSRTRQTEQQAWRDRIQDQLASLKDWTHIELSSLSTSCVRRDEIKDIVLPIRQDVTEVRAMLNDIQKIMVNQQIGAK